MNWKIWLLALLLMPLMVGLGIWQLQRAGEKQDMVQDFERQLQLPAVAWSQLPDGPQPYSRVALLGQYRDLDWLLDNEIHQGQFGYGVFTPFCSEQRCILVDRGWVPGSLQRDVLPSPDRPESTVTVSGTLDRLTHNPMVGGDEPQTQTPFRVQQIELAQIESRAGITLEPWILRLDADSAGHFQVIWQPVIMGPEKHYGYAVQWFCMALALAALVAWLQRRDKNSQHPA